MNIDHIDYEPEGTLVSVDRVLPFGLFDTVIVFEGYAINSGATITFGVDHRPARALREALLNDEDVLVDLPDWAILSRVTA